MLLYFFIAAIAISGLCLLMPRRLAVTITAGLFLLAQLCCFMQVYKNQGLTELYFFTYDKLAVLFFGLLNVAGMASFVHSIAYLDNESLKDYKFYNAGFILLSAAIAGAYFSNNAMVSWIFLEVTTIAAAVLIYHRRTQKALEATWKYIFVCSTGVALAYFGILFLSLMLHSTAEADMSYAALRQAVGDANSTYLKLAFLFIVVGYSCKMEVFPLHTIGIDANNTAPAPASAFLSTAMVNMGFVSIFRIYGTLYGSSITAWMQGVLMVSGILSVLMATIYLRRVKNLKRLMAYSTVENMGIVLIALSLGGAGFYVAVLHTVVHTLVKSGMFLQLSQVGKIYGTYNVFKTGSYARVYPLGAVTLVLTLLGITATPPSGLFLTEVMLFKELTCGRHYVVFILLAVMLCLILYALYNRMMYLCYNPLKEAHATRAEAKRPWLTAIQLLLVFAAFILCFYQPLWLQNNINEIISLFTKV
jgi:hydrogenase-4 component F